MGKMLYGGVMCRTAIAYEHLGTTRLFIKRRENSNEVVFLCKPVTSTLGGETPEGYTL